MIINQYKKDEKNLMILERIANDEKAKFSFYNNGNRVDKFIETKDTKIVELNSSDSVLGMPAVDILQTENFGQKILSAAIAKISSVEVNGINCYAVDRFFSPYFLLGENKSEHDIDKETGLGMKSIIDKAITTREYEYDNVDDNIFVEPDISQYKLQENK